MIGARQDGRRGPHGEEPNWWRWLRVARILSCRTMPVDDCSAVSFAFHRLQLKPDIDVRNASKQRLHV